MNNSSKILIHQSKHLVRPVIIVTFVSLVAKTIGILNNSVIANRFGTSKELDIFLAVQSIVDLIVALITITLGVVFVPEYIELIKKGGDRPKKLTDNIFSFLISATFIVTLLLIVFANPILNLFFNFNSETITLAKNLFIFSSLSIIPFVLASLFTNILISYKQFAFPAIITLTLALLPSLCIVLFSSSFSIYALSISVIITSWSSLGLLIFYIYRRGFRFNYKLSFTNSKFNKIMKISFFLFISASAVQLNLLVDRVFAFYLPAGSISALYYARAIREIPLIAAMSLPLVILPYFTEKALLRNEEQLSTMLSKSLRVGSYLLIPAVAGIFVLSHRIIDIIYLSGTFTEYSKQQTVELLNILLPGLVFYWLITIFTGLFYAKKNYKVVVIVGLLAISFNLLANSILVRYLSVEGLALSTSLMEITFFFLYVILTKKMLKTFNVKEVFLSLGKISITSILMIFFLNSIITVGGFFDISNGLVSDLIKLTIVILLGIVIYIILSIIFKLKELNLFIDQLRYLKISK